MSQNSQVPDEILKELIERVCKCGCGSKFKTMPKSKAYYASISHEKAFWHPISRQWTKINSP